MKKKWLICTIYFLLCGHRAMPLAQPNASLVNRAGNFLRDLAVDAIRLNLNLFSVDSAKIVTGVMPFYIGTRFLDEKLQCHFYDPAHHKNINQFPHAAHALAKSGVAIPILFLSSAYFWGWNDDLRYTGWMTGIGIPFVQSGKDVIKKARAKGCLRPWHEDFSKEKRSSGGFPSGHMANIAFMTTLWGIRHGPKWAVPIGLFGVFVMVDFINCNRHYVSQLVAGVGLGVLYGVAASKVVDKKLDEKWNIQLGASKQGDPCLQLSYRF